MLQVKVKIETNSPGLWAVQPVSLTSDSNSDSNSDSDEAGCDSVTHPLESKAALCSWENRPVSRVSLQHSPLYRVTQVPRPIPAFSSARRPRVGRGEKHKEEFLSEAKRTVTVLGFREDLVSSHPCNHESPHEAGRGHG